MSTVDVDRPTMAPAPPDEELSAPTVRLAQLSILWGAIWLIAGLFLILNDVAGFDVLWGESAESGGVGVLAAATGGVFAAFGFIALRARTWVYRAFLLGYAALVPVSIMWLLKGTALVYGVIHLLVWGFALYLTLQEPVRTDLHAPPLSRELRALFGVVVTGIVLGLLFTFTGPKIVATLVGVVLSIVIAAAIFVGINRLFDLAREDYQLFSTLAWGLLGVLIGFFIQMNAPPLGGMPFGLVTIAVAAVAGGAYGRIVRGATTPHPSEITKMIGKARVWIFVGPALAFITVSLVVPTIRTVFLSFFSGDSSEFVGLRNFGWVFTNESFFSMSGWSGIFTSRMTLVGLILFGVAVGVAAIYGRRRGTQFEFGGGIPAGALVIGSILISLAIFTSLRGAIWNNLWWVTAVTGLSTALGLIVAVIADRVKTEAVAKSFIFLPMAISMVGAGVIWKFVYDFSTRGDQIGLLNSIWQAFGNDPVFWLGQRPWNNFMLIIVMIWIQTGFAMVVLSAAIKGVPTDQVEAAKVDGATEVDIFWKVTIPTIRATIATVTTTLIILVMKVYDIVKVMTNGEFGTEVLANAMFNQAFTFVSFGRGSALATILFLAVLPMMFINIRRVRAEQAIR